MDESSRAAIGAAYDVVADSYAKLLPDSSFESPSDLEIIDRFLGMLPGRRVLDAGCGTGRMMAHLLSVDCALDVCGIDLSEEMVRIARSRHPTCRVDQGDIARIPCDDHAFGGVLAWYSVIHTAPEDLHAPLAEFARVLSPGGCVLVGFQAGSGRRRIENAYGHDVTMTAFLHTTHHVAEVMHDVGLRTVERFEREPRAGDRHPQGFVIGTCA